MSVQDHFPAVWLEHPEAEEKKMEPVLCETWEEYAGYKELGYSPNQDHENILNAHEANINEMSQSDQIFNENETLSPRDQTMRLAALEKKYDTELQKIRDEQTNLLESNKSVNRYIENLTKTLNNLKAKSAPSAPKDDLIGTEPPAKPAPKAKPAPRAKKK